MKKNRPNFPDGYKKDKKEPIEVWVVSGYITYDTYTDVYDGEYEYPVKTHEVEYIPSEVFLDKETAEKRRDIIHRRYDRESEGRYGMRNKTYFISIRGFRLVNDKVEDLTDEYGEELGELEDD